MTLYDLYRHYNTGGFGLIANFDFLAMGLATIFLWFQALNVTKNYRMALTITSIVTFIETYHYSRSFNSWVETFDVQNYG